MPSFPNRAIMNRLYFDGFIRLEKGDRYLFHAAADHDLTTYHAFGFWWFAVGWHFK